MDGTAGMGALDGMAGEVGTVELTGVAEGGTDAPVW